MLGMPRQHANMLHGKGGTQRGDHVGHAGFVHHDDIGIAFANDGNAGRRHSRLGLIEAKKHFRFMEDGGFLRVEVLRLALAHHASAERNHIAVDIANREHNAVEEAVTSATAGFDSHVGLDHFLRLEALRAEIYDKRAGPWSKTELPLLRNLSAQITPRQIGTSLVNLRATPAHKLGVEEFGRGIAYLFQASLLTTIHGGARRFGNLNACAARKLAHGIDETDIVELHHEAENVSAFAAAETMPQLRRRIDFERGGFLVMERAATPEIAATLTQNDPLPRNGDQIARLAHAANIIIWNSRQSISFPSHRLPLALHRLARRTASTVCGANSLIR